MSTKASRMAVIAYREWLNWLACGELRLTMRAVNYKKNLSFKDFCWLMKKAPDVSRDEDQAFLVVLIKRKSNKPQALSGDSDPDVVPLSSVLSFHPMSERGAAILKGDARRACCKLQEPLWEKRWLRWVKQNKNKCRIRSANNVLTALSLRAPDNHQLLVQSEARKFLSEPIEELDKGEKLSPDEAKIRGIRHLTDKLFKQPLNGWLLAFRVYKHWLEQSSPEKVQSYTKKVEDILKSHHSSLSNVESLNKPLTSNTQFVRLADSIFADFPLETPAGIHPVPLAIIFHYQHVIAATGTFSLDSLSIDLGELHYLGENWQTSAAIAAYYIGMHVPIAASTAMVCSTVREQSDGLVAVSSAVIDVDRLPVVPPVCGVGKPLQYEMPMKMAS